MGIFPFYLCVFVRISYAARKLKPVHIHMPKKFRWCAKTAQLLVALSTHMHVCILSVCVCAHSCICNAHHLYAQLHSSWLIRWRQSTYRVVALKGIKRKSSTIFAHIFSRWYVSVSSLFNFFYVFMFYLFVCWHFFYILSYSNYLFYLFTCIYLHFWRYFLLTSPLFFLFFFFCTLLSTFN